MGAIALIKMGRERRIGRMAMTAAVGTGLYVISFIQPASLPLAPCFFHSLTGHSCLTCGMTRSLYAIAHGNLTASMQYHIFGPLVFGGMILGLFGFGIEAISGIQVMPQFRREHGKILLIAVAILWMAYGLIRLAAE